MPDVTPRDRREATALNADPLRDITEEDVRRYDDDGVVPLNEKFNQARLEYLSEQIEADIALPGPLHAASSSIRESCVQGIRHGASSICRRPRKCRRGSRSKERFAAMSRRMTRICPIREAKICRMI